MRRRMYLLTAGLALGLLVLPARASAQQPPKPDPVTIDTVDHVELTGTYWPSLKGKKAPVAILLHRVGGKSTEGGLKELAEELQKAGFAVLAFDFRGHGGSTAVGPKFWDAPHNRMMLRHKPGQNTIALQDFPAKYLPYLVNDIAAAKRFLERRYNDSGDCNASNIVLVGAEDGATLGALWMASEARRYRLNPFNGMKNASPESKDVVACVWLSISSAIGPQASPGGVSRSLNVTNQLPAWIRDAGNSKDSKVPMAFLYGKQDRDGDANALRLLRTLKPGYQRGGELKNDDLKTTGEKFFETKLAGSRLLTGELPARGWILKDYVEKVILDEKKGLQEWEKRDPEKSAYVWEFGLGKVVSCNPDNFNRPSVGKLPNPLPLTPFGFRP
jgi:pimeloyl-ACP methyl ester carboxylesterase